MRICDDMQIRARLYRFQKRPCRAVAEPALGGTLDIGHTFLGAAVIIGIQRHAHIKRRLDKGLTQRMPPFQVCYHLFTGLAPVKRVSLAQPRFKTFIIGQNIGITPAAVAQLGPGVKIH